MSRYEIPRKLIEPIALTVGPLLAAVGVESAIVGAAIAISGGVPNHNIFDAIEVYGLCAITPAIFASLISSVLIYRKLQTLKLPGDDKNRTYYRRRAIKQQGQWNPINDSWD